MRKFPDSEVIRGIRMLLTDVDGVLTDGRIHFDANGQEFKSFHVHDGAGFVYWHRCGGISGFISGRSSQVVAERGEELGVAEMHLGRLDKMPVLEGILERHDLRLEQVAYVGDDLSVDRHRAVPRSTGGNDRNPAAPSGGALPGPGPRRPSPAAPIAPSPR